MKVEPNMSLFRRCDDVHPERDVTMAELVALVRGEELAQKTARVREALAAAGGFKKAKPVVSAKMELPCVAMSGTGPGHKATDLRQHSGFVQLDFDGPKPPKEPTKPDPEDFQRWEKEQKLWRNAQAAWLAGLPALRQRLQECPHIALAAESSTGTGLKAALLVAVPEGLSPEELQRWHEECAFPTAQRYARETFGAEIDSACCDPMRLAFLGHHPAAYFNPDATPLPVLAADNADNADNAEGLFPKSRSGFADAMHRAEAREDFAKWANEAGFAGDLRELELPELLKSHGFTVAAHPKGLLIACPWQGEHSTGSNRTDTMILHLADDRGFSWGFECLHEHCQNRTIRDVLTELESRKPGSVDAYCRKAYCHATIAEEAEQDEAPAVPAFPLDSLNPVARAVIADIADIADVNCSLPGAAALGVLAAAIGRGALAGRAVRDLSKPTPGNLLIIGSAPTAYGKAALEPILAPLRRINSDLEQAFANDERASLKAEAAECAAVVKRITGEMSKSVWQKKSTGEMNEARKQLAVASGRAEKIEFLLGQPPQMIVGSATGAALALAMKRNGETLFSFGYEAADIVRIALGKYSKDCKADFDLILSSYTGEPFRESRATRGSISLESPCLSALWLCQPSVLAEVVSTPEARQRGMLARFAYSINVREKIPHESAESREPDEEARAKWSAAIERIHREIYLAQSPVTYPATNEAREVFRTFHNRSVDERNGPFREEEDLMGRLRENAIRFALGQAVLDYMTIEGTRQEITADQARRGVALAEWGLYSLLALFGPARHAKRQNRLRELVKTLTDRGGECTLRVLRDSHGFSPDEVRRLSAQFPARLKIEQRGSRRPSEKCLLLPPGKP